MTPRKLIKQAFSAMTKLKTIVIQLNCCCRTEMTGWLVDLADSTVLGCIVFHRKNAIEWSIA